MEKLVERITEFVKDYMQNYDASHDFSHIHRVFALAKTIECQIREANPASKLDSNLITLASLLHDVGDKKYLKPGEDSATLVEGTLVRLGADLELAKKVQLVVSNVSYSREKHNPQRVQAVLEMHPELGIVQDADRLDAMGAIGIGRTFTFNAAHVVGATLEEPLIHFEEKLLKLASMMKTEPGRQMAEVRTHRLRIFQDWWNEESLGVKSYAKDYHLLN